MTNKSAGQIKIPKKPMVQPHELRVAKRLATTGEDVEFLPVSLHHTADILFRGLECKTYYCD